MWHLTIAYNGTQYAGWQIQPEAKTVHGEIQTRLRRLFRDEELTMHGTSRTDAGVHAIDQHATFTVGDKAKNMVPARLQQLLNRWLPSNIRIVRVTNEPASFHARHCAVAKAYVYAIHNGLLCSPFGFPYMWNVKGNLNIDGLMRAASRFVGKHDFAVFSANPRRQLTSTVRNIYRLDVCRNGANFYFIVIGDAFLYKMVRTLIGYLVVNVGLNHGWHPGEQENLFKAGVRPPWIRTAPPEGLFLTKVFFEKDAWIGYKPILPPHHWQAAPQS